MKILIRVIEMDDDGWELVRTRDVAKEGETKKNHLLIMFQNGIAVYVFTFFATFELAKIKFVNINYITWFDKLLLVVSLILMVYTLFVYCKAYDSVKNKL